MELAIAESSELLRRKQRVAELRERARRLFSMGASGVAVASVLSEETDRLLVELWEDVLASRPAAVRRTLEHETALVALGGTGRGELAPYSDLDLLFLHGNGKITAEFHEIVNQAVRAIWDSGLKLGHSVRTVGDCIALSRQDGQIATSLVEQRRLWGSEVLCADLQSRFQRLVIGRRRRAFLQDCLTARRGAAPDGMPLSQELEPDIKSSVGGLRDLHLIRWIGYALHGVKDLDALRLAGALTFDDARRLREAWEFLTKIRIDLHFAAGKAQDRLTRDEQMRITTARSIAPTSSQRAVEVFMQEYFRHSSEIARMARRLSAIHQPRSYSRQVRDLLIEHRAERVLRVSAEEIDVSPRSLPKICRSLESVLQVFRTAASYGLRLSPRVMEAVRAAAPRLDNHVSPEAARLFLEFLRAPRPLGPLLRELFDCGVLDILIPDVAHARNLMQFNQYHQFTVDEHTLRAVERCTGFLDDPGPLGAAYREIRHKELLHLALILHDLGKGFGRPHAEVGREIALSVGRRLHLSEEQANLTALLVHKHLDMAHTAFRRDLTDEETLIRFAHDIGTPEALQMLYVLTAADVGAVGPAAWTDWKAELLTGLFDNAMVVLSGKPYGAHERERIRATSLEVADELKRRGKTVSGSGAKAPTPVEELLASFSAYYLSTSPAERIADDLQVMQSLGPEDVHVSGHVHRDQGWVEYRVITASPVLSAGCFHKLAGALTARRLEILTADINTTKNGVVVDAFQVADKDLPPGAADERIASVSDSLRDVLFGRTTVEALFRRNRRFGVNPAKKPISDLPLRVLVDTRSSETRTIIDVFAHDRPGLLYTTARTLFELGLSVDLAKIATHFDQVVDVFYVVEPDGSKVVEDSRLVQIQQTLLKTLTEFESGGFLSFVE